MQFNNPILNKRNENKHMKTITKLLYLAFAVVSLAIGAVTAQGALNDLFASVNGDSHNGGGFIYEYTPGGVQSTFASGLSRPRGVAFDHSGNLFVATNTANYRFRLVSANDFENYSGRRAERVGYHSR